MPTYICDLHFSGLQISYLKVAGGGEGMPVCSKAERQGPVLRDDLTLEPKCHGLEKCHKLSCNSRPDSSKSPQIFKVSLSVS